uniref:Thioredoxin domain-containing protein n=2 Tax=Panagrellus redivivus TaxID=6233 RepID=A0A7E4V0D3_PANRE
MHSDSACGARTPEPLPPRKLASNSKLNVRTQPVLPLPVANKLFKMRWWLCLFGIATIFATASVQATKIPTVVLELNDKFADVMNEGLWFVKFYAPWCAHCKRLAPVWDHLGHALADINSPVRVGKVDCTRFMNVASQLRINAYPTIIFFRNGIQIPYEGERKKEAMLDFIAKSSGPVVAPLETAVRFSELRKTGDKDPFFVYIDDTVADGSAKQGESDLFTEFEKTAEQLFTESRFVRATSMKVFPTSVVVPNRPAVVVFKDGGHYVYDATKYPNLTKWINAERWPLLPQATPNNIASISETGKLLVFVISDLLDRSNLTDPIGQFYKIAKEAAILVRQHPELVDDFQFAWLDGPTIANSIIMGSMPNPDIMVFNHSSYEYYLSPDSPSKSNSHSIVTFLQMIKDGNIHPQGGRAWSQRIKRMFYDVTTNVYDMFRHQPILTVCLFGVPIAFFSIITYSIFSADFSVDREEIYPDDEDEDYDSEGEQPIDDGKDEDKSTRRRRTRKGSGHGTGSEASLVGSDDDEGGDSESDHEKAE